MLIRRLLLPCIAAVAAHHAGAARSLADSLCYKVEMQATLSEGNTPLWLNANKYGLSSLAAANGYLRAALGRPLEADSARRWGVGYGLDLAVAHHFTSAFVVQQAFVEGRWLHGTLTVGSREYPMELKNNSLSSGSQTLGINARPVPQVRVALPQYWALPFTKGWVSIKGHIAYGMTTDDSWQADFTGRNSKYTENTFYHSKAGYLRVGKDGTSRVSLELGLEMACQFGGTSYVRGSDGEMTALKNKGGIGAFLDALIPGGADVTETTYQNAAGNQLGSWVARLNFDYDKWYLGVYADHFFEDHSSMFMLDYDGYGEGDEWEVKKDNRYMLYDMKDIMLGAELRLKRNSWLNDIVLEYIYTKYQSGPIYHDHTPGFPDHVGGIDNYYNHYVFTGWQHWGQVMGNPLYTSPIYNTDGIIAVKNNRFVAWHLGLAGDPAERLHYRLLATWQRGYGTYYTPYSTPYPDPRENVSVLAEAAYVFPETSGLDGWSVSAAWGADFGQLLGNNCGFQLTVAKKGVLNFSKKGGR